MKTNNQNSHNIALLDSGNTRLKIGLINNRNAYRSDCLLALKDLDQTNINNWFKQQGTPPSYAIGVNVASAQRQQHIDTIFFDLYGIKINWITSQQNTAGVFNSYTDPNQLGSDRWVAMLGLSTHCQQASQPMLLASFGTATTIDTLVPAGFQQIQTAVPCNHNIRWVFEGGLILPGPALMGQSLNQNTARLPLTAGQVCSFPIDTGQSIASGIAAAQAGSVIRQWWACLQKYKQAPVVYCTGGGLYMAESELQTMLQLVQEATGTNITTLKVLEAPILDGLVLYLKTVIL